MTGTPGQKPDEKQAVEGALTGARKDCVGVLLRIQARTEAAIAVLKDTDETDVEAAGTVGGKLRAGRDLWSEAIGHADNIGKRKR